MKKKILVIIIFILILFGAFLVYLNRVLLPTKLKAILVKNLETAIQRKVTLDSLNYNIIKGVELRGLTVFENADFKQTPFLKIKEISFNFLYLPLFKERKVIITSLRIDSPEFELIRDKNSLWNFSDLLNLKSNNNKAKPKLSVLIYKISVLKGMAVFVDKTTTPYLSKQIKDFNSRINFALPAKLKFMLEAKIPDSKLNNFFSAKGEFDFNKPALEALIITKGLPLTDYNCYLQEIPLKIKSANIENAALNFYWQKDKWDISADIKTKGIDLEKGAYEFKGSPLIETELHYNAEKNKKVDYLGRINLNGSNITGIDYLNSLQNLNGEIIFHTDKMQFSNLRGNTLGTLINLSGIIENFSNPSINLSVTSNVEIASLKEIFKEELRDTPLEITGKTRLELKFSGLLNDTSKLTLSGKAVFPSLQAETALFPEPVKNISGEINFDLNSLEWKNLKGEYSGTEYLSSGVLKDFRSPSIVADLKSKLLLLSAQINLEKDILYLQEVTGKFINSSFKLNGDIDIKDRENPFLDVWIDLNGNLKDLKDAPPKFKGFLEEIKPEGLFKLRGNFYGNPKERKTWKTDFSCESALVSLWGLKLNNLALNYLLRGTITDNLNLSAGFYDGRVAASGMLDVSQEGIPFDLSARISEMDLAKLKMDTPFKDNSTSGILSMEAKLSGLAQNLDSWQGRSSLDFKDGNLWEINLFKGLGKFLLIPEFEKIAFNEASGDFSIANQKVYTDNLELKSREMIITAQGYADFSGKLDANLLTQFSEQFVQSSASLKKFITSILTTASNALTVKVTGTLQNPKYSVKPIVVDILKGLKGIIFENILK